MVSVVALDILVLRCFCVAGRVPDLAPTCPGREKHGPSFPGVGSRQRPPIYPCTHSGYSLPCLTFYTRQHWSTGTWPTLLAVLFTPGLPVSLCLPSTPPPPSHSPLWALSPPGPLHPRSRCLSASSQVFPTSQDPAQACLLHGSSQDYSRLI